MEKQTLLLDEESIAARRKKFSRFEVPRCYITVSNLTVIPKEQGSTKKLLDDVSFYVKPGEMTLILGEPGCGKSTLLSVLANHAPHTVQTGAVLFNNNVIQHHIHQRIVGYVTQEDLHIPTLTVRQTLDFSLACQYAVHLTDEWKEEAVDLVLDILDLKHVQHTLVGNDLIRGVSGGQRKRVTIGVALTKGALVLLMDEPTTGLDANTSLSIITAMRKACTVLRVPAVLALLQPSPEICELFDNLLVLNKGQVGYFGPYRNAVPYFDRLGIRGTAFQSDPEFLQEAVANCQRYQTVTEGAHELTPHDLIRVYHESPEFKATRDEIERLATAREEVALREEIREKIKNVSRYSIPFLEQVKLNLWREGLTNKQDRATVMSRLMRKVIMALVAGSLFFNLPDHQSGLRTRQSVLFFSLLFLSMGCLGSIEPFYAARKVYYHQRASFYYSPLAYFICKTLMELFHMVYENIVFSCIVYWMVGLNAEAHRFFYFFLMISVCEFFAVNVCRFMSSAIAQQTVASGVTPTIFAFFILFAGFLITPPNIPDWWIWLYYISPFHYGLEGLLVNELVGTHYSCTGIERVPPTGYPLLNEPYPDGFSGYSICPVTTGEQQLNLLDMHTTFAWRWYHLLIVTGYALFSMGLALWGLQTFYFPSKTYKKPSSKTKKPKVRKMREKHETPRTAAGVYMSWKNLSYSVDIKKDGKVTQLPLLKDISGFVRPGMLMALMGPSGAGKSTLLDVLAKRKTGGHVTGEVAINGEPQNISFARYTGYVEQNDILMPLATVRESIEFSARTRLPESMSLFSKMKKVDEVLKLLDLEGIQMLYGSNLSLEQRKRLTIGVELAADPQLLFLDEPTSGLDSVAAVVVMNVIKKVAETGRSVICTIHQPSASVFSYFDFLFLLKKGGETVYFGPTGEECRDMLDYFANVGFVCPQKRNPADFILDVASASSLPADLEGGQPAGPWDPAKAYETSKQKEQMESQLDYLPDGVTAPQFTGKYAASLPTQLRVGIGRAVRTAWRSRDDIRSRVMKNTLMAVLIGTSFLQLDDDQSGLSNRFVVIFFAAMLNCLSGASVIPVVVNERAVFYREDASKSNRPFVYLLGLTVAEIVVTFCTTIFLVFPLYWIVGLRPEVNHFLYFWWICFIFACQQMTWAHFLAIVTPNGEVAQGLSALFMSLFSLFAGFMITKPQIPNYWIWMYYLSMMHYPVETLLINELDGLPFNCPNGKGAVPIPIPEANATKLFCPETSGNQLLNAMSLETKMKYPDM
eukprot:Phypoly_transcript_00883.p1 GENE.Phypoly_transcript_00883~~Phypoly_transcript_00883.p1  ORF type:complete len:1263 (+),score=177.54 Phypoly_transcript_00883:79-3867(+)